MQIGFVGLGRMGANMARRLRRDGHDVVGHDVDTAVVDALADEGVITGATTPEDLVAGLDRPRTIWVMIPAAFVASTMETFRSLVDPGDVLIDGGNSFYRDAVDRAEAWKDEDVHHVDVGVSGGIWGLERGYCLMIGGDDDAVARLTPVFRSLAPGIEAAPRTRPERDPTPQEEGWLHCGPAGAGHFVKMVHNGIEYGLMAAYAEGFAILDRADAGREDQAGDAETAPLRGARYYRYDFDIPAVAEVWRRGAVVGSWLLDLTARALADDPALTDFVGRVSDSGEGRWTLQAAVDEGVPANVIASALHQRFSSRDLGDYGDKLLSAMREQFGGHAEKQ